MNKYQKLICQMAKDDIKKPFFRLCGISFKVNRNSYRTGYQGTDLRKLREFKNFNKNLKI